MNELLPCACGQMLHAGILASFNPPARNGLKQDGSWPVIVPLWHFLTPRHLAAAGWGKKRLAQVLQRFREQT
ncbi:hypothetical protein [Dokdonella sp.]|uniref:hypothetical protein n=1 Tax=Dokdonella sp. TaxID=2291710 RepID=UPI002DD620DA|nr:hypothetical protein [Dokdonella sp.]